MHVSVLQEHVLERRYTKVRQAIERGSAFLRDELRNKGVITDEGIKKLRSDISQDRDILEPKNSDAWFPENYRDGAWIQMATIM
jgi:hypothetical protein